MRSYYISQVFEYFSTRNTRIIICRAYRFLKITYRSFKSWNWWFSTRSWWNRSKDSQERNKKEKKKKKKRVPDYYYFQRTTRFLPAFRINYDYLSTSIVQTLRYGVVRLITIVTRKRSSSTILATISRRSTIKLDWIDRGNAGLASCGLTSDGLLRRMQTKMAGVLEWK